MSFADQNIFPKNFSVLVVDDDHFTQKIVSTILNKAGIDFVFIADSVKSAFLRLSSGAVDLVICDLEMKPVDGLTFIRQLRTGAVPEEFNIPGPIDPSVPLLVLTAHTTSEMVERVRKAGADGFITKPVKPKLIIDRIMSMLPLVCRDKDINNYRIIYASEAKKSISRSDVLEIFQRIQKRNFRRGVTGCLCLNDQYFLQVLEGPRSVVEEIFQRIEKDERHENIKILFRNKIETRVFRGFGVYIISDRRLDIQDVYERYSGSASFNPTELTYELALSFLREISN